MPEWTTYKGQHPWALEKQGSKFGYVNNPNFRSPATEDHAPCGYWNKGTMPKTADYAKTVWYVDGVAVTLKVIELGEGKECETFAEACLEINAFAGSVLLTVFPGSYESGSILAGANRTVYVRGMGASPLDVEFLNCCPQVSGTGCNLFLENIYIHYETGAGFTSLQFSASMNDLTLNKVYITDPNVPVEYTPFLAGLTWTGSLNASNCTIAATWNWELVFFQFDPSRITFNKVSYVGGYWGESSCAVQFATYNSAVEDCGALYGSYRITEETEIETLSITPLWSLTRWQTFDKDLYPWQVRVPLNATYNEGDKITLSPKVFGGSPVWDMVHLGNAITEKHDPCKYWTKGEYCACLSVIAYTTLQMSTSQAQTLTVTEVDADERCFTWYVNFGTLDKYTGKTVVYTAPSSNPNCANNATIKLFCYGVEIDSIQIGISSNIGGYAYYATVCQKSGSCSGPVWDGHQWKTTFQTASVAIYQYTCKGVGSRTGVYCGSGWGTCTSVSSPISCSECLKSKTVKTYCSPTYTQTNRLNCEGAALECTGLCILGMEEGSLALGEPYDIRTPAMLAAGCCPAALM